MQIEFRENEGQLTTYTFISWERLKDSLRTEANLSDTEDIESLDVSEAGVTIKVATLLGK
jgi:hypothetical protein